MIEGLDPNCCGWMDGWTDGEIPSVSALLLWVRARLFLYLRLWLLHLKL